MTEIHGFQLIEEREIPELQTFAQLYRHIKTGAELLSLQNDDENKSFGITFRTPPSDSTGVAHILEHSVLCGSRRYPVKEPFIELAKGSLKTFLNAMTGSSETYYPVASTNLRDFYNLIDVYLDCVFYPNLTPHTFAQEGWHYELEDAEAPLIYKGVVFNEMKGYYASPDVRLHRYADASIFPDNCYGQDSGGDPRSIPNLTFEQFKNFHETFYHPSNARIAFYGDDDPTERLRYMNEWLKDFEAREIDSSVPLQSRFEAPKRLEYPYPVEAGSPNAEQGHVMVNWLLDDDIDPEHQLALSLLSYILVHTPASPVRKALIDSGLGEEVTGGLGGDQERTFHAGLKAIDPQDAAKVEDLIFATLREQVEKGLDPQTIEAAVNTYEFHLRENNTGSFPRGLALMFNALNSWLHGGDPIEAIAFEKPLNSIKTRLAGGERIFEDLIARYLLDNNHRTTIVLTPDTDLSRRENEIEEKRLQETRAALSAEEVQSIIEETQELKRLQETPDSPEALATIPTLQLEDLDRENKPIPLEVASVQDVPLLYHDLFTNGIIYFDIGMNLRVLPQELLPYVPLFGRALTQIGTEQDDFVRLTQRIGGKTGGIWTQRFNSSVREADPATPTHTTSWLFLRGKALPSQSADMIAIMRDVLLTVKLDNKERFRQMALEEKARLEAQLGFGGSGYVHSRLLAHFHEAGWVAEQMGGISYLFFVRRLVEEIDSDWAGVLARLEQIRTLLVNSKAMLCNLTVDEETRAGFTPQLENFLAALPQATVETATWNRTEFPPNEGLTMPTQVNSVGQSMSLFEAGYRPHGSAAVVLNYLRATWMWEQVRMKGGAYGAHCSGDSVTGVFTLLSSQDPNLLPTVDIYRRTPQFLRELELSRSELTRAIIGTISNIDMYQLPDAKGWTSLQRYLANQDDEYLQLRREEVLNTRGADFRSFADILEQAQQNAQTVVLGSPDTVEAANRERDNWLKVVPVL